MFPTEPVISTTYKIETISRIGVEMSFDLQDGAIICIIYAPQIKKIAAQIPEMITLIESLTKTGLIMQARVAINVTAMHIPIPL